MDVHYFQLTCLLKELTMTLYNQQFDSISKGLIGFDDLFRKMQELERIEKPVSKFPPYNIIKDDENTYRIALAVAGFSKEQLSVTLENTKLTVMGSNEEKPEADYIYKGIAERNFTRVFTVADTIEVRKVVLENGILEIVLDNVIPESKKRKTFLVEYAENKLLEAK